MPRLHLVLLELVCALFLLLGARRAEAASFQVNPVSVTLSATTQSATLGIRNMGDEEVRVQINVFNWKQTLTGEIDLQPTRDVVFFPSILTIAPHDSRNVRVSAAPGLPLTTINVEKTYRVIVEELLPPVKASLPFVGLRVLTRMSIPVFVEPPMGQPVPQVEGLLVRPDETAFSVANKGTRHFMVSAVRAFVTAPDGRKLFETSVGGWYVLAQGSRSYRIPLPASACSNGGRLTIEVQTDHGNATQTSGSMQCN